MSDLAIRELVPNATETGLDLPNGLTEFEWVELGEKLGRAARASAWWIGDWINYGEARWGQKYEEAMAVTGLSYEHLQKCASVAARFELRDRSRNLTWSHHFRIAAVADASSWLELAAENNWSVREMLAQAEEAPRSQRIQPGRRHGEVIRAAEHIAKLCKRWDRPMTDSLTPREARKQLAVLQKAREQLDEVIDAVEYRAATLPTFNGR